MRPNNRYLENIKTKFLYLCLFIRLSPLEILPISKSNKEFAYDKLKCHTMFSI